jgi:hypothetical protein
MPEGNATLFPMASPSAERVLQRGTWALLSMWLLGLVSTLYLYVQPFLLVVVHAPGSCPDTLQPRVCAEWSTYGPDPHAFALAAPLLIGSLVLPLAWHRRALSRLSRHARPALDPGRPGHYRAAPGTVLGLAVPELAARAAVRCYAGRLAMALSLLLPVYFLALREGSIATCFHCPTRRIVPKPADYVPLLALSTLLLAFHLPTRRRVLGPLGPLWKGQQPGPSPLTRR